MSTHHDTSGSTRRLAGCLTYLVAGALLVYSASRALDWWEQSQALRSGASSVMRTEFDERGNRLGDSHTPVSAETARASLVATLATGAAGLGALVVGLVLQGSPWRALTPRSSPGSKEESEAAARRSQ